MPNKDPSWESRIVEAYTRRGAAGQTSAKNERTGVVTADGDWRTDDPHASVFYRAKLTRVYQYVDRSIRPALRLNKYENPGQYLYVHEMPIIGEGRKHGLSP